MTNLAPHGRSTRCPRVFLVVLILSLVAAACGTIEPESIAFADTDAEQTTLRIATSRIEGFEAAIASWERDHPTVDIEVMFDSSEDHHEWLREGANGPIDIIAFEGEYSAEARALPELFVDLNEHDLGDLEADVLPARWNEGFADDGALIGLPIDVDAQVLIVRRDLLQPATTRSLIEAEEWCDVIEAGNDFVTETDTSFFGDGEEVLRAILSQSRSSWVTADGTIDSGAESELLRAWNLAMLTVGVETLGPSPCPGLTGEISIARDLEPGESVWNGEIANDNFAAVIAKWSTRERISEAYPESAGRWLTVALPIDDSRGPAGTSSEAGLHFGIAADSPHVDIALDFLLTVTDPVVQRSIFADGLGPLPAARSAYTNGSVPNAGDGFLVGTPTIGSVWADAVQGRSELIASEERPVVISSLVDALGRVQSELDTPDEAWNRALNNIVTELSER